MIERLHFLVVYVGSAAMVAFLAVCLSSPRVGTFTCHPSGANGAERCELSATLPVVAPEAGETNRDNLMPDASSPEPATVVGAAAQ